MSDGPTATDGGGRSLREYVLPAAGLFPVAIAIGAILQAYVPSPLGIVGGAVAWFLLVRGLFDLPSGAEGTTPDPLLGGAKRERLREANRAIDDAGAALDAIEADAHGRGLPVARGILDRAERYRDHEAPDPAERTAERARRVAETEAAVRSRLAAVGPVRQHVAATDRIERLLDEAEVTAATDPERAADLVEEGRDLADELDRDLRARAADRAETARRVGDPERSRRRYAEAYELADAAARLAAGAGSGAGDPTDAAGPAGDRSAVGTDDEGATGPATGGENATDPVTAGEGPTDGEATTAGEETTGREATTGGEATTDGADAPGSAAGREDPRDPGSAPEATADAESEPEPEPERES